MDAVFAKLAGDKKNTVENIVNWIHKSKLIDGSKEADDKVRTMFNACKDVKNVQPDEFHKVIGKLSDEYKTPIAEIGKKLAGVGTKLGRLLKLGTGPGTSTAARQSKASESSDHTDTESEPETGTGTGTEPETELEPETETVTEPESDSDSDLKSK